MKKAILYIHGKGGNAAEGDRFKSLCPDYEVLGLDYKGNTPWDTKSEILLEAQKLLGKYSSVIIIANSIGAYFTMNALGDSPIEKALFISPIVNMERLICDMMQWANVTEDKLKEKDEIPTEFGEVLSYRYLRYVRENPIKWNVPTEILYAECDNLTSIDTVTDFAEKHGAGLTIMENGEHWLHTEEQLAFLDQWVKEKIVDVQDE